ncbi:MAG: isomerase [Lentisphaeria bacterium]|nr:isomerase [Lentisphaeria bacterium]
MRGIVMNLRKTAAVVDDSARIGERVQLGEWVCIGPRAEIGSDVKIGSLCVIPGGAILEDSVRIGDSAVLMADPDTAKFVRIGNGAVIGANATILPVTIGAHAMVGAGAVVTKNVPPYAIVVGNPARIVGYVGAELTGGQGQGDRASAGESKLLYSIPSFSDIRGDLSVLEFEKLLPFPVKRIFYTYGVGSSEVRGEHAHKVCEQFLIALHGSLHVIVDDGRKRGEYVLDTPTRGLHLPSGCWGIQYKHSADCVLLVLASRGYEPDDYIRDYNEFLKYKSEDK